MERSESKVKSSAYKFLDMKDNLSSCPSYISN